MGSKTLLGFFAGVSAGAILGILFAPDKGAATREKIAKKGGDFSDSVKDSFSDFIDNLKNSMTKTKDEAGEWVDSAKNKIKIKTKESTNPSSFQGQNESFS